MRDFDAFHTSETQRQEWAPGNDQPDSIKRQPLLDRTSEPRWILDFLLNEALTSILLISDGAIASYTAPLEIIKQPVDRTDGLQRALADAGHYNHSGDIKGTQEPVSGLAKDIEELRSRYDRCRTHRERLVVIKEAQTAAVRLRYAPNREFIPGTREWREKVAHDTRDNATIALDYGISGSKLLRIRKEFGTARPRGGYQSSRLATNRQSS